MPTNSQAQLKKSADVNAHHPSRGGHSVREGAVTTLSGRSVKPVARPAQQRSDGPTAESRVAGSLLGSRHRSRMFAIAKRTFDIVVGSSLLIVAAPVILIAATVIRVDTPGNPFFFQTRLGMNGKPFKLFKLRGMFIDARARFPEFYDYSAKRDLEFCFHHANDPRVTRAGRFLRRTSIDELPNLWNVLRGDMSLVGPRPEIPDVLALYGMYREEYLSMKPGVTCLSKCTGRDRLTKLETVQFDLGYVRSASFRLDLKILWRTFRQVLLVRDVF